MHAQLALHDKVGQDVIAIGADNYYIAEGFGCQTSRGNDEVPALLKPPCATLDGVFELEVPDPLSDGRMPVMLEALRLARKAVGDEVALRSPGTGPFALASYFIGSEQWLHGGGVGGSRTGGGQRGGLAPCAGAGQPRR